MSMLNRALLPNISKTSKNRYRCRIQRNGKVFENYTTSLTSAKTWIKQIKSKYNTH